LGLIGPFSWVVYFRNPLKRLIIFADFGSLSRFERDQKISKKKSISVISAGSSEAGERYQNSLHFPHSKAVTIPSSAGRFKMLIKYP
jgi:hypothetical protein